MIEPLPCPHCGQPIAEINWEPTIVRSNVSEEGIIGAATFDTLTAVQPGTFTAQPCGHRVDTDRGRAIWEAYTQKVKPDE